MLLLIREDRPKGCRLCSRPLELAQLPLSFGDGSGQRYLLVLLQQLVHNSADGWGGGDLGLLLGLAGLVSSSLGALGGAAAAAAVFAARPVVLVVPFVLPTRELPPGGGAAAGSRLRLARARWLRLAAATISSSTTKDEVGTRHGAEPRAAAAAGFVGVLLKL